jgi:hypothetical protein
MYFKPVEDAKALGPKGDWEFREFKEEEFASAASPASDKVPLRVIKIRNKPRPTALDLAKFSRESLPLVEAAIETAVETAQRMYPFLAHEGHSSDLCDPELDLDENYGGECCWRCGEGGTVVECSRCRTRTHLLREM